MRFTDGGQRVTGDRLWRRERLKWLWTLSDKYSESNVPEF